MFRVKLLGNDKKLSAYLQSCLNLASEHGDVNAALSAQGLSDLLVVDKHAVNGPEPAGCLLLIGGSVVRCGLGGTNAVTLSSIGKKKAVLSIQETVETLTGIRLEPQDIPVFVQSRTEPSAVLAASAALVMLGSDFQDGIRLP